MSDRPLPAFAFSGGIRVAVKVVPKASANRILGIAPEADGSTALRVAVAAAPEDGKANAALVALLAQALDRPRRDITVTRGQASRRKTVEITGSSAHLLDALRACCNGP